MKSVIPMSKNIKLALDTTKARAKEAAPPIEDEADDDFLPYCPACQVGVPKFLDSTFSAFRLFLVRRKAEQMPVSLASAGQFPAQLGTPSSSRSVPPKRRLS